MKLVIFDLDQTLVESTALHDQATQKLFKKVFGVDASLIEINFAGRDLIDNFAELGRLKGVPEDLFAAKREELIKSYDAIFGQIQPQDGSKLILPGVEELLKALLKTGNFVVLYTGDSPGVGQSLLAVTGLGKYFKFAVYGTDVPTRVDMVKLAVKQAAKMTGKKFENGDVVIVGDSVRDIDCGKAVGARTIAVATGIHSASELLKHNPDYLVKNLSDYEGVLEAIG